MFAAQKPDMFPISPGFADSLNVFSMCFLGNHECNGFCPQLAGHFDHWGPTQVASWQRTCGLLCEGDGLILTSGRNYMYSTV